MNKTELNSVVELPLTETVASCGSSRLLDVKASKIGLLLGLGAILLMLGSGYSQERLTPQEKWERFLRKSVDQLIEDLKRNPNAMEVAHRLRELGDRRAIPPLKEAFKAVREKFEKQAIASALVALGEPDKQYWDFLVRHAKAAVESDMPFPLDFDSQGRGIRGKWNPEFLAWAARNNIASEQAGGDALYGYPTDVMFLGMTGDRRAFEILLRGLESKNYLVVSSAAQGLANLQDKRAIKPTIEAAKRAPSEAAQSIAEALVFFDDTEAHAAEQFITDRAMLEELRKRAREKGRKGIYGL